MFNLLIPMPSCGKVNHEDPITCKFSKTIK